MHGVLEEIERIKAETRNAVIEECAKVADAEGYAPLARRIAKQIRALKDKP